ncbi:MAG: pilus assembly protein [Desulfatiglandales bacterium]
MKLKHCWIIFVVFMVWGVLLCHPGIADDTCSFMITADDVGPNIVFLLDNGANMEHIKYHGAFNSRADFTPNVAIQREAIDSTETTPTGDPATSTILVLDPYDESSYQFDVGADVEGATSGAKANVTEKVYADGKLHLFVDSVVGTFLEGVETVQRYKNKNSIATGTLVSITAPESGEGGEDDGLPNGFFNENGYAIVSQGGKKYLVRILDNLTPDSYANGLEADTGNTWTINGKAIALPAAPSSAVDGNGIKDNATIFRYSKNYLNWLFFYEDAGDLDGDGAVEPLYDLSALPDKSRYYYAKQALLNVAKLTANRAFFGIYNFSNDEGASNVQPLGTVVDTVVAGDPSANVLDPNYVNNINNMGTVTYSPLAEGLGTIAGYYNSPSSGVVGEWCQKNFVIVVSSGLSSQDQSGASQYVPQTFSDYDGDAAGIGEGRIKADESVFDIPTNYNGSTWLDDVAHYLYTHDIVGYEEGFQNVYTYTVGFMGDKVSNMFLINTSNNGNGTPNLYDTTDKVYGKYHFTAEEPDGLSSAIMSAVNEILSRSNTFTAPVVPVTRTTSGNRIYMAFFKPSEDNFWEGNVVKFGIGADEDGNIIIVDALGDAATWDNGALKEGAVPFWSTKTWADPAYHEDEGCEQGCNFIGHQGRNVFTFLGQSTFLTASSNAFVDGNILLTEEILGSPTQGRSTIINYIRGADALDENGNGNIDETRSVYTGDVLHSEPFVFEYRYPDPDDASVISSRTMVFFGANDGMLHAVNDYYDPDVATSGGEEDLHGTNAWSFIPPDLLSRLKDVVEGYGHQVFVDSSPKVYFKDVDGDGIVETGDQVILVCGARTGGTGYFALDVTSPLEPRFLWRISQSDDSASGGGTLPAGTGPDPVIPELGESWSEPQFGLVKTNLYPDGRAVFFIGGGYSSDNSAGKAILAVDVLTGDVVRMFKNDGINITDMDYSIPSTVMVLDTNSNGFVDKVYVGDLGSQMWRLGKFTDEVGSPLGFPNIDENIDHWEAHRILVVDPGHEKKFFYPPTVGLEKGYDLVLMGTGDRQDACSKTTYDGIYAVKDYHTGATFGLSDLVDVTNPAATPPNLDDSTGDVDVNGHIDQGWYILLNQGEKVLAEGVLFYKAFYVTTFTPNDDPCLPGGYSSLYALGYKTGAAVLYFGNDSKTRSTNLGGGIPSKPVTVITGDDAKLFISVGSTDPDGDSESQDAGVVVEDPLKPEINFFYLWWYYW